MITGTGSGKTEAFLYPILDHVRRAKRAGVTGMKALVLYPMNALANDQALRLARLLTDNLELAGITAALYTGDAGPKRTTVAADGLITDREIIRDLAPDILLTNYKMLDQLLLRPADADLWRQSGHSLQYLVLDEFHTYDGAQGTDVSMLLRRLGLTLKSHWTPTDPGLTPGDWARPLGRLTPVATSATLGDGGDPAAMLGFAATVFGERFPADAVVTESRLGVDEWVGDAAARTFDAGWKPAPLDELHLTDIADAVTRVVDPAARTLALLRGFYDGGDDTALSAAVTRGDPLVLDLLKAHPVVSRLAEAAANAVPLDVLDHHLFGAAGFGGVTAALIDTLSQVRARHGRGALSIDVHLWVRVHAGDRQRPEWSAAFLADRGTRKPSPHTVKAYRQDVDAIAGVIVGGEDPDVAQMKLAEIGDRTAAGARRRSRRARTHRLDRTRPRPDLDLPAGGFTVG